MKKFKKIISGLVALSMTVSLMTSFATVATAVSFDESKVLLSEPFDSGTGGFTTTSGGSNSAGYLDICVTNGSVKTDKLIVDTAISKLACVDVSFKWKTGVDLANTSGGRQSVFELLDSDGAVIFCMSASTNKTAATAKIRYGIGARVSGSATGTAVSLADNNWYDIKLSMDFANKKLSGTITDSASTVTTIPSTAITAKNFSAFAATNISSLAAMAIDDIKVYKGDMHTTTVKVRGGSDGTTPLANATVVVGNQTATTDANGDAIIELPSGTYRATISASEHFVKTIDSFVISASADYPVVLDYVGVKEITAVTITGGDEYIYKPAEGTHSTVNAYTATVFDQTEQAMNDEAVTWSVVDAPQGASVADGIVTLDNTVFAGADINGTDIIIRATSVNKPAVYADVRLHIRQIAELKSFDVAGPAVAKEGKTATYSVTNKKDQYGVDFTGDLPYTLTTDREDITVSDLTITPHTGTVQTAPTVVTITADNGTKATKDVTVYAYDFYDPFVNGSSYAQLRVGTVAGGSYVVWPASGSANVTGTITFPEPITLNPGDAKVLSFSTAWTKQTVTAQERSFKISGSTLVDGKSGDADLFKIGFNGGVYTEPSKIDGVFKASETGNSLTIGSQGSADTFQETLILFKKDLEGATTATVSHNGGATVILTLPVVESIKSIGLVAGTGAPDDRLLAIKDLKIANSDIAEVEISGLDQVAKISGKLATATYKASIFSRAAGETFEWSQDYVGSGAAAGGAELTATVAGVGTPIVATYADDGKLSNVRFENQVTVTAGQKVQVSAEAGSKVMLWNSVGEMAPMAEAVVAVAGSNDSVAIDQNGVLTIGDAVPADTIVTITYASTTNATKKATKQVTVKDFATVSSFDISGPAAVNAGENATYSISNVKDQYNQIVDMAPHYAITTGADIATIDAVTGVLTTTSDKVGNITVSITVGNPGIALTLTKDVVVGKFSYVNENVSGASLDVDVSVLANYSANTLYRVTAVKADGTYTITDDVAHVAGTVTVNTTDINKVEVSPIYLHTAEFNGATAPLTLPVSDAYYDVTVKKVNGGRVDVFVNGNMIANNLCQYGADRSVQANTSYTAKAVKVEGGSAIISTGGAQNNATNNGDTNLNYVQLKKVPSIVAKKTHVYITGDSLVASYYGTYTSDSDSDGIPNPGTGQTGWGEVFAKYVSGNVNVTNLAESGNYAKGLFGSVVPSVINLASAGDYFIFECGYNDANYSNQDEMKDYMAQTAALCAAKGINLIFASPTANAKGDGWKAGLKYAGGVVSKAAELGVPCIDVATLTYNSFSSMKADNAAAQDYCKANFNVTDLLHSTYLGAMKTAELIAQNIYDQQKTNANLAGIVIDTNATYTLKDSEGKELVMQVK